MFPDFSKIFGRDFIIGYFLPAVIFLTVESLLALILFTDVRGVFRESDVPVVLRSLYHGSGAPSASAVEPLDGRVVVAMPKPGPAPKKPTPAPSGKELVSGSVVSVASSVVLDPSARVVRQLGPGDTAYFAADAGVVLRQGSDEYRLLKEADIISRVPSSVPRRPMPPTISQLVSEKAVILLAVASGVLGIAMMAINRGIYRFVEGYGTNPLRLIGWIERLRYRWTLAKWSRLDAQDNLSPSDADTYMKLSLKLAEQFPDEDWLLPTRFGNIIRAFEVYSRLMYGLDSIPGWERLELLFGKDTREAIAAKKAQVDFWLNLWAFAWVVVLEGLAITWHLSGHWWLLPGIFFVVSLVLLQFVKSATLGWGESVKAAIDLHVPALRKKLRFTCPADAAREREMWERFSQAILYRRPDVLPARIAPPRPANAPALEGGAGI